MKDLETKNQQLDLTIIGATFSFWLELEVRGTYCIICDEMADYLLAINRSHSEMVFK